MPIVDWLIALLVIALMAVCWLLYRAIMENGRTLLRLEAAERQLATRNSTQSLRERWLELVHPFFGNDQFDVENIIADVLQQDEYQLKQERFEPGDVVIDVGANVGSFSLLCHLLGSRAIFAYESADRNFGLLQDNVGSLPGVHVFHSAVWRSDGHGAPPLLHVLEAAGNSGAHTVMASRQLVVFADQRVSEPAHPAYPVSSIPLDTILERFNRVKLLKLDCEGSEFPILLTSHKLERVQRIVGEIHEMEEEMMKALDERSRLAGYPDYRKEHLVTKLEAFGFRVTLRPNSSHIFLFDARRSGDESYS